MLRSAKSSTSFRSASGPSGSGDGAGLAVSGSSSMLSRNGGGSANTLWPSGASSAGETGMHPNLGLHNAAATGNIGLVKFALDNGQPHTSVLNGLLPLHAACSGGSEAVVRLLLGYGADVNSLRLKTPKGASLGPGTGTEGSTPLHFAAANGHTPIVRLLVEHGARPTASDKDGLTPESLATAQGHAACVSLLRSWIAAYGPNGLAGIVPGKSASANPAVTSSPSPLEQGSSASIRSQKSFEQLSSAAAGVKASLRQHKKHALARVSSNPSLKSSNNVSTLPSPPSPPPPLPTARVDQDGSWEAATATSTAGQGRESKRRPSLPSIVERAAHMSSSPAAASHHLPAIDPGPPESIEVLSYDSNAKDNLFFPPPSPSRTTLRLTGKRSLTGLLRKATGMAHDGAPPSADLNPPVSAMPRSNTVQERSSSGTLPSPLAPVRRARSKSNDLFANPFLGHPARTNTSNTPPSQSSPSSSSENVNGHATKQTSPALHAFRPRKSSNLSNTTNSSTLTSQGPSEDDTTSKPVFHPTIPTRSLTVEHGRKRAQSTTSVPKRVGPMHDTGPTYTPSQLSPEESYDDAQEFLNFSLPSAKEKSGQSSRFRSMISGNNNRSPLLTQKLLTDEGIDLRSSHPSSPSFGTQPLRSRESNSSLISSASSTNANLKQQQSLPPPPPPKSTTRIMPEEESTRASSATRGHRSASNAESVTSKPSTSSLRSFGASLTAQEQAQAILRSADGGGSVTSADGTTISLTQMLAAYGEALAQERKGSIGSNGSSSSLHLRKQASLASLGSSTRNHQLPIVNEHSRSSKPPGNSETPTGTSIRLNQTGSLTSISTPPDSPLMTRSRAESSATSFSRSPSSHRQKATPRGMQELVTDLSSRSQAPGAMQSPHSAGPYLSVSSRPLPAPVNSQDAPWSTKTSLDTRSTRSGLGGGEEVSSAASGIDASSSHKHSPSLPADLSQFASVSPHLAVSSNGSTPRSQRRNQHRPTTSDSHSSLDALQWKRLTHESDAQSPTPAQAPGSASLTNLHKTHSISDFALSAGGEAHPSVLENDHQWSSTGADHRFAASNDSPNISSNAAHGKWNDILTSRTSSRGGRRKGTVKAFFNGIRNNVVG